ncbi:O-methyltransferase family protein [Monoraphidium neglectum]|uniref:O-methyltransferase family protein n=1 Tax=Monoraphidium neglectum TaxID=145388 RepID=A0A0D2MXC1_9CHLO|nr:O-methyltransferase family protein [Monoraphidium neglectum]KIZ07130.1 O-methyltransferase family protein [Monoraphidium neglectum]|eukprot:XP_013906149.1 O-methyltransferase family protein [Monoraphidium neglectum]
MDHIATAILLALAALGAGALLLGALALVCVLVSRPWDPRFRSYGAVAALPFPAFRVICSFFGACERLAAMKPGPFRVAEVTGLYVQSQVGAGLLGDAFALNAVSACLLPDHPAGMGDFVALFKDHYDGLAHLSEGLRRGVVPFKLTELSKGRSFFDVVADSERHAKTFDGAMRQVDNISGGSILRAYPWRRFDHVVDVAGGNGQFLARLLAAHPKLRGTLFDLAPQVERGKQWWREQHAALLPRASFAAGDMFDPSTLPAGAAAGDGAKVAYVLRNILHDWDDKSCLAILGAIREHIEIVGGGGGDVSQADGAPVQSQQEERQQNGRRVEAEAKGRQAAGRSEKDGAAATSCSVRSEKRRRRGSPPAALLIVEATLSDAILPCNLKHRHVSDMTMMMVFGSAKERDERQFGALLAAAGWRLRRVVPTTGLYVVIEALPAP